MNNSWVRAILCLLAVLGFVMVSGCANYNKPELQRRRSYAVEQDLKHLADDVDWVLGLHRPAPYDETMR